MVFHYLIVALLHSLWQSAVLTGLYYLCTAVAKNAHPLQKRNFIFSILVIQLFLTLFYLFSIDVFDKDVAYYYLHNTFSLTEFAPIFAYSYISIVLYKIISISFLWYKQKKRYAYNYIKPSVHIKLFTILKATEIGITQKVQVWYSNVLNVPITFGFLKPIILIPLALVTSLTQKEIEAIVIHELTHIKNNDYLINWVVLIIDAIYFFNPFIKKLTSTLWLEREKNCDLQVLQHKYEALPYAQVLLKIAKNQKNTLLTEISLIKNNNTLLKRVQYFLRHENINFKNYSLQWVLLLVFGIIITPFIFTNKTENKLSINLALNNFTSKLSSKPKVKLPKILMVDKLDVAITKINTTPIKNKTVIKKDVETLTKTSNDITVDGSEQGFKNVNFDIPEIDSIKNVEYFEENSNGKTLKLYQLIKTKGKWILVPKIMLVEKYMDSSTTSKPTNDSIDYQ